MNILHVVNVFFVVPYFLGDQLKYFKDKGYNVFLVCSPSLELEDSSKEQGFKYKEIPVVRTISILQDLKSLFQIYKYIKQNKIEIVSGHTPKGGLLAMLASFLARVPKRIYFRHGLVFETSKGLTRIILVNMDRLTSLLATKVVCVSPSVYKKSLEYKLNSEAKQIILSKGTCNGINLHRFNPENISLLEVDHLKSRLNIPKGSIVIGFTGRLVRDKGIIELVKAFKILQSKYDNLYLLLVGMLEMRDAVPHDIIEEINQNPFIVNTGYINNKNIQFYYKLMDIYVLPSYREGFPTSVLEASAMELPVLTTRVTGCVDSIIEGKTGEFIINSAESIERVLVPFIDNVLLREEFGNAGRTFVKENFEEKKIWEEIEKLYF